MKFDVVVIGGGSAGYAAARTAREHTDSVAIIDAAEELGGLCILRGCMPSKTLIYSAEILHFAKRAEKFGLRIPEATADMKAIHKRKVSMIDEFKSYRQEQLKSDRFHLIRDKAHFISENELKLMQTGETIVADKIIIATGSAINTPPVKGLDSESVWTSDDVLDLDFLPDSVIVLGGGIVACELAQFLNRAGSKITQIQRSSRILKDSSPEASEVLKQALIDEGIDLVTDTQLVEVREEEGSFIAEYKHQGQTVTVKASHLFNALGRKPATQSLNLSAAGIEHTASGQIIVNSAQQTSNPNVYAAGDVCGPFEIVHLAIMQGETAALHALQRDWQPVNYRTRTDIAFTDPQVATAGLSISAAQEEGIDLVIADYPFDDHGKSILMEAKYGYVKVWADRVKGTIVGAECVGKDAGELIHSMAVAVSLSATIEDLLKVHWYHPTLSEIWSYPLEDIAESL